MMPDELDALLKRHLAAMNRNYLRAINRDLARHNSKDLFLRNVMGVLRDALTEIQRNPLIESVDSDLLHTRLCQLNQDFIDAAVKHNRSSCAVSNFPQEHNPPNTVIAQVLSQCERIVDQCTAELEGK